MMISSTNRRDKSWITPQSICCRSSSSSSSSSSVYSKHAHLRSHNTHSHLICVPLFPFSLSPSLSLSLSRSACVGEKKRGEFCNGWFIARFIPPFVNSLHDLGALWLARFWQKTHLPPPTPTKDPHIAHGPLLCIENQEQAFFSLFFFFFPPPLSFFLLDYIIP
jgi:hypothetical protein